MDYINIAIPKGKMLQPSIRLFKAMELNCIELETETRKLCIEDQINKIRFYLLKPSDITTFVEAGACDIGIAGLDTILEDNKDIDKVLDLEFGVCKMVVAGKRRLVDYSQINKVATKYPNIAKSFFEAKGINNIEILKVNGSVEAAPIAGLSDIIVDIVQTGRTLEENNLEIVETVCDLSARLIMNRNISKVKEVKLDRLIGLIEKEIKNYKNEEII